MKRLACVFVVCVCIAGCGGAANKVLQDFGIQNRPEGYVSGSDRVMERMNDVGKSELNRLNLQNRRGEVRYDDTDRLHGKYYKVVKVYERFYPLDANASGRTSAKRQRGFVGYIDYSYSYYESPRKTLRAEAAIEVADIPTGEGGRETYRYRFDAAGTWNGGKGELIR